MNNPLFPAQAGECERLAPQTMLLHGYALPDIDGVISCLKDIEEQAPFRCMLTPNDFKMSMASSNCGELGWISDRTGYRYSAWNPATGKPWPAMPVCLKSLAQRAALAAGFADFTPDACLINRYEPGSFLSLHRDEDEQDFSAPIVSLSLGMSATFLWGGLARTDKIYTIELQHGDVMVWGGQDRMRYHGVQALANLPHPIMGLQRINLTFRKAV